MTFPMVRHVALFSLAGCDRPHRGRFCFVLPPLSLPWSSWWTCPKCPFFCNVAFLKFQISPWSVHPNQGDGMNWIQRPRFSHRELGFLCFLGLLEVASETNWHGATSRLKLIRSLDIYLRSWSFRQYRRYRFFLPAFWAIWVRNCKEIVILTTRV